MELTALIAKLVELQSAGAVHVRLIGADGIVSTFGASLDSDTGCVLLDATADPE